MQAIKLTGTLDQYAAESLKSMALSLLEGAAPVSFDLSAVDHIHASSLQVLLALQKDLQPAGRTVSLINVEPKVRELFRISGTAGFFRFSSGTP